MALILSTAVMWLAWASFSDQHCFVENPKSLSHTPLALLDVISWYSYQSLLYLVSGKHISSTEPSTFAVVNGKELEEKGAQGHKSGAMANQSAVGPEFPRIIHEAVNFMDETI